MYAACDAGTTKTRRRRRTRRHSLYGLFFVCFVLLRVFEVPSFLAQSAAVSTIGDGRRIILWRSAPAGTIGYTESSCSTWKSISAARAWRRAASTAPATSLRRVTVVAAIPNASASFAKFGPLIGVAA